MPPKPRNLGLYGRMGAAFVLIAVGGPAFTYWLTPTEEELFKKYNPELQKRSLENRVQKEEEFDQFVTKLKEYSKSDRPIWQVAAEAEKQERLIKQTEDIKRRRELQQQQQEMKKPSF